MHVIPAIKSGLEYKGRLDSFDGTIATRCAIGYVIDCSEIVAKRQPEEDVSSRQAKCSIKCRYVRVEPKSGLAYHLLA